MPLNANTVDMGDWCHTPIFFSLLSLLRNVQCSSYVGCRFSLPAAVLHTQSDQNVPQGDEDLPDFGDDGLMATGKWVPIFFGDQNNHRTNGCDQPLRLLAIISINV